MQISFIMSKMDDYISGFTQQIKRAVSIGESAALSVPQVSIRNILFSGLGGSGIGGSILSDLLKDEIEIPIIINKNYHIPAFVDENTLVVIVSYSGNTEETISAMMQAHKKKANIVCISSGGLIKEYAELHKFNFIEIDGGMPPRACLALSFVQIYYTLHRFGLVDNKFKTALSDTIELLNKEEEDILNLAKDAAATLYGTLPVIYVDAAMESVAVRFRQQLNENSKMLCWHHVIPEMNHNELVGWVKPHEDMSVVFLRNESDFKRNQKRMNFTKNIVSGLTDNVIELFSKGNTNLERSFYFIHLCDWVSAFLADMNEVDAVEVNVITSLKNKLAENPI